MVAAVPTLADVAQRAGVSRAVAGHVLNQGKGNTRVGAAAAAAVRAAATELGYIANSAALQLRGRRSMTYGLLVESSGDPLRSFLVQHLDEQAVRHGCRLLIGNTVADPVEFSRNLDDFRQRRVDGVICVMRRMTPAQRKELADQYPRTVFYGDSPSGTFAKSQSVAVNPDQEAAGRLAVEHLVSVGCSRIAFAMMSAPEPADAARLAGFRHATGITATTSRLIFQGTAPRGSFAWKWSAPEVADAVDLAIAALVGRGRADGLVVQNDFWASIFLRRLRVQGIRVPQQVSVIGYLNHYLAEWTDPPLSTIDLDHRAAAVALVAELERRIAGEQPSSAITAASSITPHLIVRDSTRRSYKGFP